MVIGRAVNRLEEESWRVADLEKDGKIDEIIDGLYKFDSMFWVTYCWHCKEKCKKDYRTWRSAFWRFVKSVVEELKIGDITNASWPTYLIYSNLYKVSLDNGGNPTGKRAEIQRKDCIELLKKEISQWQPEKILFLTGLNWAEKFLMPKDKVKLGEIEDQYPADDKNVQLRGKLVLPQCNPIPIVVANHPQGLLKKELDEELRKIVDYFRSP